MTPVLEAVDLYFKYGDETLLAGICFQIMPGDFVAVTGSNGAGKSTLLRLILGELSPEGGSISLFGEGSASFKGWAQIGYVRQANPAFAGSFPATVEETVLLSLYARIRRFMPPKKEHREAALKALDRVGMLPYQKRMISELSGGQLQRVMVARALAGNCKLLLLDEPATGVDAEAAESLYRLLYEVNQSGVAILMVTHDTERAAGYINRVLCIEEGTVVELLREQLADELRHKHKHH